MIIPESLLLSQVEARSLAYLLHNHKLINELKPQGYFFNKAFAEIYHALYSLKDVDVSHELLLSRLCLLSKYKQNQVYGCCPWLF